jgi:hypothetical protein
MQSVRKSHGWSFLACLAFTLMLGLASCKTADPQGSIVAAADTGPAAVPTGKVCAAVRGNGQYLFSHFGSLAAIAENYGAMEGMAGGSSASITTFMYESMLLNPALNEHEGEAYNRRLSLIIKSVMGYMKGVQDSEEGEAIQGLAKTAAKVQQVGLNGVSPEEVAQAAQQIQTILADPGVVNLVNPNVIAMLRNEDNLGYRDMQLKVEEIRKAAEAIGAFDASDEKIFFREGIVNFEGLANVMNRIANFYAGYGIYNADLWKDFLDSCSQGTKGLNWRQVAGTVVDGKSCHERFTVLQKDFRGKARDNQFTFSKNRQDDKIGLRIPVVLASSVIKGKTAMNSFRSSLKRYRAGLAPDFKINFDAVQFGYFVPPKLRQDFEKNLSAAAANDKKLTRYYNINKTKSVTWNDVLRVSAMEPGLAAIKDSSVDGELFPNPGKHFGYAGGWTDLHPVQVLKAVGCDEVIYVTRRGEESSFITKSRKITDGTPSSDRHGVAELLNLMNPDQQDLFLWDNPSSGYSKAVQQSAAIWCTDWNMATATEFEWMFNHSYDIGNGNSAFSKGNEAGLVANSDFFKSRLKDRRLKNAAAGCLR